MRGLRSILRTLLRPQRVLMAFLWLAAVVLTQNALAEKVEDLPKPTNYVSDFANVLSPATVTRLDHLCGQLDHSQANTQIAVVTIHTLDGDDSADYASRLEESWKMGKKGSDRGILILLAVQDHKRRIDVAYGLEGILPDAKVGDIGRSMVPYLRANDFDSAMTLAVTQLAQPIAADAKITLQDEGGASPMVAARPVHQGLNLGKGILLLILLIFFGGFYGLRLLMGWGLLGMFLGGGRGGGPWMGGGFGGGGGGGGGDSGGFGGFGGGDFGGGGAGGDW